LLDIEINKVKNAYEKYPLVSIIIPNYNGKPFIERCLGSVMDTDYSNFEVIFIDDGSTDDSLKIVKESFGLEPRLNILENDTNLGAAASRNIAMKVAKGEYFVFLDNDTEVARNWLDELVSVLRGDESIGAAQSKILDFNERNRILHAGTLIIPYTGWVIARCLWRLDDGSCDSVSNICALSVSLAVKREVLARVGAFDEELSVFTEDVDFSWRIWLSEYRVVVAPKSRVYHWNKPIVMRRRMFVSLVSINFHLTKNSLRTIIKNYELKNLFHYMPWFFVILFSRAILVLLRRKDSSVIVGSLEGIVWNLLHLHSTVRERYRIQRYVRRVKDDYVMQRIMVNETPLQVYRKYFSHLKLI